MKPIFLTLLLAVSFVTFAQEKKDTVKNWKVVTPVTISTKNVWRGVNYGNNTPSIQATLGLNYKDAFEIGACGTATLNGDRRGFGNWMELYTSYTVGRWSLTVDDYYFFSYDSLNDYLNWDSRSTQHLVETRLKYNVDSKFNIMASYNIYAAQGAKKAFYFEMEYFLRKDLSVLLGGVTGPSWLNYYDAAGITTVGLSGTRDVKFSKHFKLPLKVQLICNPNYKNIAKWDGSGYVDPGYNYLGRNAINFVVSTSF